MRTRPKRHKPGPAPAAELHCTRKKHHNTYEQAVVAAESMIQAVKGAAFRPYKCPDCRKFHVTSDARDKGAWGNRFPPLRVEDQRGNSR
jgi:hypothetical protein